MVPVTVIWHELLHQKEIVDRVYKEVCDRMKMKDPHLYGTMVETPRAALRADYMAGQPTSSAGTNDLTQMSFGFSRDDIGGFRRSIST